KVVPVHRTSANPRARRRAFLSVREPGTGRARPASGAFLNAATQHSKAPLHGARVERARTATASARDAPSDRGDPLPRSARLDGLPGRPGARPGDVPGSHAVLEGGHARRVGERGRVGAGGEQGRVDPQAAGLLLALDLEALLVARTVAPCDAHAAA